MERKGKIYVEAFWRSWPRNVIVERNCTEMRQENFYRELSRPDIVYG